MVALSSYLQVSSGCNFSLISGEVKLFFTVEQVFQRPVWIFTKTMKKWWEALTKPPLVMACYCFCYVSEPKSIRKSQLCVALNGILVNSWSENKQANVALQVFLCKCCRDVGLGFFWWWCWWWWSLAVCLLPEATPSATVINAAAYLPTLGSGVPFLLLYPAAPAAMTQRTRTGLFLSWLSSAAAPPHPDPPTQQPSRKPPKCPKPSISLVSTAYYTSAKTSGGQSTT